MDDILGVTSPTLFSTYLQYSPTLLFSASSPLPVYIKMTVLQVGGVRGKILPLV